MRVQITLPLPTWERLCEVAHREHRPPKHQIEYIIEQAVTLQARQEQQMPRQEGQHASRD